MYSIEEDHKAKTISVIDTPSIERRRNRYVIYYHSVRFANKEDAEIEAKNCAILNGLVYTVNPEY